MKYLRYYLIRAGLCLLLFCSANGASAQIMVSLEMVSTTTFTINFSISLSERITGSNFVDYPIVFFGVPQTEGRLDPVGYTACGQGNPLTRSNFEGNLSYNVCIDANSGIDADSENNITLRLSSFDRRRTIRIELMDADDRFQRDPNNFALSYPGTAIFLRSKVFLEGPLQ